MAFERTFQNITGRWAPQPGETGGEGARQSSTTAGPAPAEWGILLEQASDLNDELCREHCELQSEVSCLRERRHKRQAALADPVDAKAINAARAAEILPRVMSHVRRGLRQPIPPSGVEDEELLQALEDAVRQVFVSAADVPQGSKTAAAASSEETATLIQEKLMLKEMSLMNQERLLELELARDKLSGNTQGSQWASRLLSNVLQGTGTYTDPSVATGAGGIAANGTAVPTIERPPESSVTVGSEHVVVGRKGAILRESEDLESDKVATLVTGSRVRVLEVGGGDGRRAKVITVSVAGGAISSTTEAATPEMTTEVAESSAVAGSVPPDEHPVEGQVDAAPIGWLSVTTKDGKALLRPVDPHEAERRELDNREVTYQEMRRGLADQQLSEEQLLTHWNNLKPAQATPSDMTQASGAAAGEASAEYMPPNPDAIDASASESATGTGQSRAPSPDAAASAGIATGSLEFRRRPSDGNDEGGEKTPAVLLSKDQSTVTVSTDYWLSLRNERNQREQQIRALELQVAAAQREIETLAEIRAQLREKRSVARDVRQRSNELREVALMASEELRSWRILDSNLRQDSRCAVPVEARGEDVKDEDVQQHEFSAPDSSESEPSAVADAEEARRGVEWRRLLSERETTARELAHVLQQAEEYEVTLEDRRIEMQAAEKRRDRERFSLLTALRELDWQGGDQSDTDDAGANEAFEGTTRVDGDTSEMTTSKYIQRISELEDCFETLQGKLDAVQAREVGLNKLSVLRGEALRYAATAAGTSMEAALVASRTSKSRSSGLHAYFEMAPTNERHRADLDGLASLLEGLFVENFALRSEVLASNSSGTKECEVPEAMTLDVQEPRSAANVDLTRFIKNETDASDDDDDGLAIAVVECAEDAAPPLTPRHSEYWPDSPRSLPSPRLPMLAEPLTAFDFTDMSVAES